MKLFGKIKSKNLIHVAFSLVSLFFCVVFPLRRAAFVSLPPRGLSAKKASSCVFKECFLHFKMVSHYNREFRDGYKWKARREKKAKFSLILMLKNELLEKRVARNLVQLDS